MNRARFLIEAAEAVVGESDADRVGVRLSPTNPFNDMADSSPAATFAAAVGELNRFGLAYLHVVESVAGDPIAAGEMPDIAFFRKLWRGVLMGNKGYDLARANAVLRDGLADLISFAALFLANPDFPYRDSPSTIHKVLRDPAGRSDRGHIFVISYCFETLNMGNSAADGRIIGIARSAAIKRLAIRRIEKAAPAKTRRPLMIAALKFLGQVTNEIFESRVQRVARKICEHQHYFGHCAS